MTTKTETTLAQFIADHKITMTAERTDSNPHMDDSRTMDHWKVTMRFGRRQMSVIFSQGYGHNGAEPELSSVLNCLSSDASSVEDRDFAEWADDMGMDSDSRKAERTYKTCIRQARKLEIFLGPDAYTDLLQNTERL